MSTKIEEYLNLDASYISHSVRSLASDGNLDVELQQRGITYNRDYLADLIDELESFRLPYDTVEDVLNRLSRKYNIIPNDNASVWNVASTHEVPEGATDSILSDSKEVPWYKQIEYEELKTNLVTQILLGEAVSSKLKSNVYIPFHTIAHTVPKQGVMDWDLLVTSVSEEVRRLMDTGEYQSSYSKYSGYTPSGKVNSESIVSDMMICSDVLKAIKFTNANKVAGSVRKVTVAAIAAKLYLDTYLEDAVYEIDKWLEYNYSVFSTKIKFKEFENKEHLKYYLKLNVGCIEFFEKYFNSADTDLDYEQLLDIIPDFSNSIIPDFVNLNNSSQGSKVQGSETLGFIYISEATFDKMRNAGESDDDINLTVVNNLVGHFIAQRGIPTTTYRRVIDILLAATPEKFILEYGTGSELANKFLGHYIDANGIDCLDFLK